MNAADAFATLRKLGVPAIDTADAAAALGLTTAAASQTLTRLARAGLVRSVRHGTWWLEDTLDPLRLPGTAIALIGAATSEGRLCTSLVTAGRLAGLLDRDAYFRPAV